MKKFISNLIDNILGIEQHTYKTVWENGSELRIVWTNKKTGEIIKEEIFTTKWD